MQRTRRTPSPTSKQLSLRRRRQVPALLSPRILTTTPLLSRQTTRRPRVRGSLRKSTIPIPKMYNPTHARGTLRLAVTPPPNQLPLQTATAAPRAMTQVMNNPRTAMEAATKALFRTQMMIPMRWSSRSRWTPLRTWRVNSAERLFSSRTSPTFYWPA